MKSDFFKAAYDAIMCCSVVCKKEAIDRLSVLAESAPLNTSNTAVHRIADPGRPTLPVLVHPSEVPRRRLGSVQGRIGLIHAVAHIEFNAVNLALDAAYRFRGMPREYYKDWIRVAADECRHFELLMHRLQTLQSDYGALPAHGGMWEMAVNTDYDVGVRMALVPRVMEARGLDVTPAMIDKLDEHKDHETADILKLILREEIDHVLIGNRWFKYVCEQQGHDPIDTFSRYLRQHGRIALRGPFNREARLQAGFTEDELKEIAELEAEFKESFAAQPA